jgi:hypothetical protein
MFYVIQRYHGAPHKQYLTYIIARCITSNNSKNIIFEFKKGDEVKRKWVDKEDIVLITHNKQLFVTTIMRLEALTKGHMEKISVAQDKLDEEISALLFAMKGEFDNIKEMSEAESA